MPSDRDSFRRNRVAPIATTRYNPIISPGPNDMWRLGDWVATSTIGWRISGSVAPVIERDS